MLNWYVLQSKSQKENLLWEQLQIRKIEVFFPRIPVKTVNPRARKLIPYFPGYMFVRIDLEESGISMLNWMPGAKGIVNFGNQFTAVPADLIATIRKKIDLINADHQVKIHDLEPGDKVTVKSGVFAGYDAIFDAGLSGSERVRVLLRFLGDQQMRMIIPVEFIMVAK